MELRVRSGEATLTYDAKGVSDELLLESVRAAIRCARRSARHEFRPGRLSARVALALLFAIPMAVIGVSRIADGGFMSGMDGISDVHALVVHSRSFGGSRVIVTVRGSHEVWSMDVPSSAVEQCLGVSVRRDRFSMTIHCGNQSFQSTRQIWGLLDLVIALAIFGVASRLAKARRTELHW